MEESDHLAEVRRVTFAAAVLCSAYEFFGDYQPMDYVLLQSMLMWCATYNPIPYSELGLVLGWMIILVAPYSPFLAAILYHHLLLSAYAGKSKTIAFCAGTAGFQAVTFYVAATPFTEAAKGMFSSVILIIVTTLLGQSLRLYRYYEAQVIANKEQHEQIIRLQEQQRLAVTLHDSFSGDLSFLVRFSELQMHENRESLRQWQAVHEASHRLLLNARSIIDMLRENDAGDSSQSSFETAVHEVLNTIREKLQYLAFSGRCTLTVEHAVDCAMLQPFTGICLEVLSELCANIVRHGACSDQNDYEISVHVSPLAIQMTSWNRVTSASSDMFADGGQGMANLSAMLEQVNGTFDHQITDNTWIASVYIPLK